MIWVSYPPCRVEAELRFPVLKPAVSAELVAALTRPLAWDFTI
jgi:hypothetical protein